MGGEVRNLKAWKRKTFANKEGCKVRRNEVSVMCSNWERVTDSRARW